MAPGSAWSAGVPDLAVVPGVVVPVAVALVADAADVELPKEQAETSSAEARRNPVVVRRERKVRSVRFRRSGRAWGRAWVVVPLEGNRGQLLMCIT
ncbi:hypothetical protein GCM10010344_54970 [Streptomyces bluensis]|nr:hypothetical protein GCM10010344_54970 [Streptomyces bluensis]